MHPSDDKDLLKGTWWFPLRKYLPGWGLPICWQGWLVLVGYFGLLIGPSPFLPKRFAGYYVAYAATVTAVLAFVISKKGEPLR